MIRFREASTPSASTAQGADRPPLAIVGIGCRFPGQVVDANSYWELLINARSGIVEIPKNRWSRERYYHPTRGVPGRMVTKWGGFVDNLDQFDAAFWGISPREASRMDPQQRWLLEVAWEAIEDAGLPPRGMRGSNTGVFVGIASNDYAGLQMPNWDATDIHTNSGCTLSIAANRVSYLLDLKGPSMSVDTACSSSLVAVSQACQAIWTGQCDQALTGGANALITPDASIGFSAASMLSPSGQCFAFDARANGYVRGEGAAMLLLKPLTSALANGDSIYAVIRAAVVNQDGHTSSMTVPSVAGQADMLRQAFQLAGVEARHVAYMEAHGTGTPVGDPIECRALGEVLGEGRAAGQDCLIGSVKTNIGHLEAGSGIAGLVKAALVLHNDTVPPNLNFAQANPNIPFEQLRLRVASQIEPLPRIPGAKRPLAAVNSFGFGGTNAHVVLEAAPELSSEHDCQTTGGPSVGYRLQDQQEDAQRAAAAARRTARTADPAADRPCLLTVSARDEESLRNYVQAYHDFLTCHSTPLRDICCAAGVRKEHHPLRFVAIGKDADQMRERMAAWFMAGMLEETASPEGIIAGQTENTAGETTFVFTGQGPQWWRMGRELYQREPVFRRKFDRVEQLLQPLTGWSLTDELFSPRSEQESRIHLTEIAQPAIFTLQIALAELWKSWGILPSKVVGHSVGELAAAYCAGIYSLEDAVTVIYHRSRLQGSAGGDGRMLAVGVSAAEARAIIGDRGDVVKVAVINSHSLVTLAGDRGPLEVIAAELETAGKFLRWLKIDFAFHSHQMDPIKDELLAALADISPRGSRLPFISTVTGTALPGEKLDAMYWWRNVRQPVLFAAAMSNLIVAGDRQFLELGPHPALESAINEILDAHGKQGCVFHSLMRKQDESSQMLGNLAGLHIHGNTVDWAAVNQSGGEFVRLPSYPWHHQRYWLESDEAAEQRLAPLVHPLLGTRVAGPQPTWQVPLDARVLDYLNDHRVWDSVILPASAYAEIGLAAAGELFPDEPYVVEELQTKQALFLSDGGTLQLRVVYDRAAQTFSVFSSAGGSDWDLHAQGRLVAYAQSDAPADADLETIKQRLADCWEHQQYYAAFARSGYQFGPRFSQLAHVWHHQGEALGEIRVPDSIREEMPDYRCHPAVLDACFQVSAATNAADGLFLPASIRRVQYYHTSLPRRLFAHATLVSKDGQSRVTDILIYDEHGRRIADVWGFQVDRVEQPADRDQSQDDLYRFAFVLSEPQPAAAQTPPVARTVLLFADRQGVGDSLAEQLRQRGDRVLRVVAERTGDGESSSPNGQPVDDDTITVELESAEDCSRAVDQFAALVAANPGQPAVVHCWSLDNPAGEQLDVASLELAQQRSVLSALRLQQALAQHDWPSDPRVFTVTRGVQQVIDSDLAAGVAAAPLIGFARVAFNEHPQFCWTSVDLASERTAGDVEALLSEIDSVSGETETAWRAGVRYANRLQRVAEEDLPLREMPATDQHGEPIPYRLQTAKPGVLTNLTLNETTRRPPGPNEIEVRVRAGGINFRDVMKALGIYPGDPVDLLWFGDDFAGSVERVGSEVTRFAPGDEVAGMAPYCFRSYCTVDQRMVFEKPSEISFQAAATLPTVFLTASYCLNDLARMRSGETILIHAGTGGVGQAAIQIARHLGLEIFATAGTPEKRQLLNELGVQHTMNSRTLEFADEVRELTRGRGVDAVLNSLSGEFIPKSLSVLAPFGRFLEIGKIDVYGNSRIGLQAFRNNISYFVVDLAQLLQEDPGYVCQLFGELAERFLAGDYQPLPHTVFPISEAVNAFRFMARGKHVGKNVLSFDPAELAVGPCTEPDHLLRADASYLITGGAGGFGLELAKWLSAHGARHLALMSRSGPRDDAARAAIEQMRSDGVTVLELRGDVTKLADVERVIEEIHQMLPPLRGVVHGAVVLDDQFIVDLDEERFSRVLHPKVLGAWNLHTATLDQPLDLFACFSSFSSSIGGTKQSNYNAGNAFLDFLAHYRRARKLPAVTICWGPLQGAGLIDRIDKMAEYIDKLGMRTYQIPEALEVFRRVMIWDPIELGAVRIDWSSVARLSPLVAQSPTYAGLAQEVRPAAGGGSAAARVLAAPPSQRPELLEDFLAEQVAAVFGIDVAAVDRQVPLTSLGLDSLMSMDLMNRVETELGVVVPMGQVLRGPNLGELAVTLLDSLDGQATSQDPHLAASSASAGGLLPLEHASEPSDMFALSESQQALWFQYRLAPLSPAYNMTFSAKFTPRIDIDTMQAAFTSLFARHPMLDVAFSDDSGQPVQRLRRGGTVDFREHDATGLTEAEVKQLLVQHANAPFDLENGPIIRLELFRTADAHIGLWGMHHIASDAWTMTVLARDLIETYFSMLSGRRPQHAPQPITYEDFVLWEQRHLASETGERMAAYWRNYLEGAPTVLELPTDHPRPAVPTLRSATHGFCLDEDLTYQALAAAAEHNVTLFTVLLTAYQVLLHRHTGQLDLIVGCPFAGRSQPELHNSVGYFVNLAPLRSRSEHDTRLADVLERNRRDVAAALENQHFSINRLVQDLELQRDPSRPQLFQTAFSMQRIPGFDEHGMAAFLIGQGGHKFHMGGMEVETIDLTLDQAQVEIRLVVEEAGGRIYGCWQYNRELFEPDTVQQLNELYADVLRELVTDPRQAVWPSGAGTARVGSAQPAARERSIRNRNSRRGPADQPRTAQDDATANAREQSCPQQLAGQHDLEQQLVSIWCDVLDLPEVGLDEGFFELGGNSLDSLRIVKQIQHQLGPQVPLIVFLQSDTVAGISSWIRAQSPESAEQATQPAGGPAQS